MGELMAEYKKYDSDIEVEARNVRLTKDAEEKGENFVKLTFCGESRGEKDSPMWWDVIPFDGQAELAKFLRKGDTLSITGFPTMQRYGESDEKVGLTLKKARLHIPLDLFVELKDRGFEPGAASTSGKGKPAGKPASKPAPAKKSKRPVVDISDDEDE
jgi:single-stranded DNA-binding protein